MLGGFEELSGDSGAIALLMSSSYKHSKSYGCLGPVNRPRQIRPRRSGFQCLGNRCRDPLCREMTTGTPDSYLVLTEGTNFGS